MINVLSFTVALFCFLQPCYCLETLPVLVVDTGGVSVMGENVGNPFNKISHEVFSAMVKALLEKASLTLIFLEHELSIEHISKKDSQGSPFKAFLQEMINEKKLLYLPSVMNPFSTLTSLLPMTSDNTHDLASAKQFAKEFKPSSHVYIQFEPEEPTVDRLRLHDLAMRTIIRAAKLTTKGSVVAFYTGINNPLVMKKKLSPKIKNVDDKSVLVASKYALFRLNVEFEHKGLREMKPVEVPGVKNESLSKHDSGHDVLSTTLAFTAGFNLRFNFLLRSKDWILDKITLLESDVEVGHVKIGVGAPLRSSYHCAENLRIINSRDQSAVILRRYQWQPSRESCELTKSGCKDKDVDRSRFKLPIGTIKDFKNTKKTHNIDLNIDDQYLDNKDKIWGNKKKAEQKHYDYEPLFEAGYDKGHEEAGNGSSSDNEKKIKKKPGYIVEDEDEDFLENKNPDGANKDHSGQKKHSADKNTDANNVTLDSHSDHTPKKDPLSHNKQHHADFIKPDQKHAGNFDTHKGHLDGTNRGPDSTKQLSEGSQESQGPLGSQESQGTQGSQVPPGSQVQPGSQGSQGPQGSTPAQDSAFGTSVNCGPFFNHEILSCLLVTFIILGMFFYGLDMMVNLQANDRFDDFGGKTLTIAEEK